MAVVGAMIAVLTLAGCGRKGGLDLPPAAATSEPGIAESKQGAAIGGDGKPTAPRTGPKTPTILDWLVE
jgi:predicted small lipoprotein YifL